MSGLGYVARIFKVSLTEISVNLGVTSQTVNDWVKGKRKIPMKRLEQLEQVFNLPRDIFLKSENELNEVNRLVIQLQYLKSINEIRYDRAYPYWSQEKQIAKIHKEMEEKKLLVKIECLFAGGAKIEDENYNPKSVRNYLLFEKIANLLDHEDENKEQVRELLKLMLGTKHTQFFENAHIISKVYKNELEDKNIEQNTSEESAENGN